MGSQCSLDDTQRGTPPQTQFNFDGTLLSLQVFEGIKIERQTVKAPENAICGFHRLNFSSSLASTFIIVVMS